MSNSYRDLIAWQKAFAFAREVYRATSAFPRAEIYGLTSQTRRAAVSVVLNIAEGQGRTTRGEFQQFLGHAKGSLLEVETQLLLSADLGFIEQETLRTLLTRFDEVSRLLNGLMLSLERKMGRNKAFTRN